MSVWQRGQKNGCSTVMLSVALIAPANLHFGQRMIIALHIWPLLALPSICAIINVPWPSSKDSARIFYTNIIPKEFIPIPVGADCDCHDAERQAQSA